MSASKSTLAALALLTAFALLAAPGALAQTAQGSLTISGLPEAATTNETLVVLPFDVTFQVAQAVCVGPIATYTVDLVADAADFSDPNITFEAQVIPSALEFRFPPADVLRGASQTQTAVLEVARGAVLRGAFGGSVSVTARLNSVLDCAPAPTPQPGNVGANSALQVSFVQPDDAVDGNGSGQAMPVPPAALLAVALLVGAALRRR